MAPSASVAALCRLANELRDIRARERLAILAGEERAEAEATAKKQT